MFVFRGVFLKKKHNMQKNMKRAGIPQKLSQLIVPFLQGPSKKAAGPTKTSSGAYMFPPPPKPTKIRFSSSLRIAKNMFIHGLPNLVYLAPKTNSKFTPEK